jgi:hypothetical protein
LRRADCYFSIITGLLSKVYARGAHFPTDRPVIIVVGVLPEVKYSFNGNRQKSMSIPKA